MNHMGVIIREVLDASWLVHEQVRKGQHPQKGVQKLSNALQRLLEEVPEPAPPVEPILAPRGNLTPLGRIEDGLREATGSKSLLLEIVRRAAYDWILYRSSRKILQKRLAKDAYDWLFAEKPGSTVWQERMMNGKELTAFTTICSLLDFDADLLRDRIRRLSPKDVMSVGRPAEYRRFEASVEEPDALPFALPEPREDVTFFGDYM